MANFAKLENNLVTAVIMVDNVDCAGGVYPLSEPIGQDYIETIGIDGQYLQTSYNNNFRGVYGQVGYTYDPDLDIFVAPPIQEVTA